MLSYALAIAVGLSSLILFSTAFLMSDIHRQDDFFWSGVGMFYALVLWFCATRITGGLLLGQTAAVALLISFNWQTLKLRKAIANPEKAQELNNFSVLAAINGLLTRGKSKPQPTITKTSDKSKLTEEKITIPETDTTKTEAESTVVTQKTPATQVKTSTPKVAKKTGFLGKFFGGKKQKSVPDVSSDVGASITNTKLDDILDEEVTDTETPQLTEEATTTTTNQPTTETEPSEDPTVVFEKKFTEITTQPASESTPSTEVQTDEADAEVITPIAKTAPSEESKVVSEEQSAEVTTPQPASESIPSAEVQTEKENNVEDTTSDRETVIEIVSTEIEPENNIVAEASNSVSEIAQPTESSIVSEEKSSENDTPQSEVGEKTASEITEETINPPREEKEGN